MIRGLIRNEYFNKTILYILVVVVVTIISFPLFWILLSAIRPVEEVFMSPPKIVPSALSLDNFRKLFSMTNFATYFRNSAIVAFSTTFLVVAIASICAYSVTRFASRVSKGFAHAILFVYMFPPILLVIPIYVMVRRLGLHDNLVSLVLTYTSFSLPLSTYILSELFKTIPLELERAAMVDGATRLQTFRKIFLPLALPGIIATGVFAYIWAWGEFLYGLVFISSESLRTLAPGMANLFEFGAIEWELLMASSIGVVLPVVIMFSFVQRYLIQGFGAGAVKG
jgi:multiple sugar transport system permease protein